MIGYFRHGGWYLAGLVLLAVCGCGGDPTDAPGVKANISGASDPSSAGEQPISQRDEKRPVVRMETTLGVVTIELDAERAPVTVKNFLWYIENDQYAQTIFHQVVPGYVAIGGGYTTDLQERAGNFEIHNEADNGLKNVRGTIAMARRSDSIDSATNQFFFNLADNPNLDHASQEDPEKFGYCVFGRVIDGQDVLDQLSQTKVTESESFGSTPVEQVVIKSLKRIR